MKILIKTILAILLVICLLKMPWGYYQFIRVACCVGFIYLAYDDFKNEIMLTGVLSSICAILFNPVFKVYLKRPVWQNIDVIIAGLLVVWILIDLVYLYNGKRSKKESYIKEAA